MLNLIQNTIAILRDEATEAVTTAAAEGGAWTPGVYEFVVWGVGAAIITFCLIQFFRGKKRIKARKEAEAEAARNRDAEEEEESANVGDDE